MFNHSLVSLLPIQSIIGFLVNYSIVYLLHCCPSSYICFIVIYSIIHGSIVFTYLMGINLFITILILDSTASDVTLYHINLRMHHIHVSAHYIRAYMPIFMCVFCIYTCLYLWMLYYIHACVRKYAFIKNKFMHVCANMQPLKI